MARDASRPGMGAWRVLLMVLAAVLAVVAAWLIVFGTGRKEAQLGAILGLWSGLVVAFVLFGSRRSISDIQVQANELHEAHLEVAHLQEAQLSAVRDAAAGQELELRKLGEIQLAREAAARREADLKLELTLRREIERMMTEQIGSLRHEVAALRAEVVDKLGREIRLERIETTRVIGSDLEALQNEIRRLAGNQESLAADTSWSPMPTRPPEPAPAEHLEIVDAEVVEPRAHPAPATSDAARVAQPVDRSPAAGPTLPSAPAPVGPLPFAGTAPQTSGPASQPAATPAPAAVPAPAPVAAPEPAAPAARPDARPVPQPDAARAPVQPAPTPAQMQPAPVEPVPTPAPTAPVQDTEWSRPTRSDRADPFADLPRLSPIPPQVASLLNDTDDTVPPTSRPGGTSRPADRGSGSQPASPSPAPADRGHHLAPTGIDRTADRTPANAAAGYVGRRRAAGEQSATAGAAQAAPVTGPSADPASARAAAEPSGQHTPGRRRAADDQDEDRLQRTQRR